MRTRPIPEDLTLEQIGEFIDAEFACDHAEMRLTLKTYSNGTTHVYRQCPRCGQSVGALPKGTVPEAQRPQLPPFDENLASEWWARRNERFQEIREHIWTRRKEERSDEYSDYLDSEEWREKRRIVLERDNWTCQGCRRARATQVHHLSYDHIFDELLFELISVCDSCHTKIHAEKMTIRAHAG